MDDETESRGEVGKKSALRDLLGTGPRKLGCSIWEETVRPTISPLLKRIIFRPLPTEYSNIVPIWSASTIPSPIQTGSEEVSTVLLQTIGTLADHLTTIIMSRWAALPE